MVRIVDSAIEARRNPDPSPTPTPTLTLIPTRTRTRTLNLSPSPSPSPTPSPSPSPTPSPSPSPSPHQALRCAIERNDYRESQQRACLARLVGELLSPAYLPYISLGPRAPRG